MLALAMLSEAMTAPELGEMVREESEFETEETAPTHSPVVSLKHPPESWMPLAKVEVAVLEVRLSTVASRAFSLVEVPDEVLVILPPEISMPLVECKPTVLTPPLVVEVAEPVILNWVAVNAWSWVLVPETVLKRLPPERVRPLDEEMPAVWKPLAMVEDALDPVRLR